jgi:hypothetical protein
MSTRVALTLDSSWPSFLGWFRTALSIPVHPSTPPWHGALMPVPNLDEILPSEIGGYRVVRVISRGTRAVMALLHADGETRVARIFLPHCATSTIDAEVAAHDVIRLADPALRDHVVALRDLVTLADGRTALLLDRVGGAQLATVLNGRQAALALGEAVTLVAPLALAVDVAHRLGMTGVLSSLEAVRMSVSGAPIITRLSGALVGPPLPERYHSMEPKYGADRAALEAVGVAVAQAVDKPHRAALIDVLRSAAAAGPLACALFDLADPLPVRTTPTGVLVSRAATKAPSSIAPVVLPSTGARATTQRAGAAVTDPAAKLTRIDTGIGTVLDTLTVLGLPQRFVETVSGGASRVRQAATTARGSLRAMVRRRFRPRASRSWPVRPHFVIVGGVGIASVVIAGLIIGASGTPDAPSAITGDTDSAAQHPADDAVHEQFHGEAQESVPKLAPSPAVAPPPSAWSTAPETIPHPQPEQWKSIVDALVGRWVECAATATNADTDTDTDSDTANGTACFAAVVHAGSAAARLAGEPDSRHALLQRWHEGARDAVVAENMGGAVLIDLVGTTAVTTSTTTTASLLLVRSEAGWRIRDVLD